MGSVAVESHLEKFLCSFVVVVVVVVVVVAVVVVAAAVLLRQNCTKTDKTD